MTHKTKFKGMCDFCFVGLYTDNDLCITCKRKLIGTIPDMGLNYNKYTRDDIGRPINLNMDVS